MTAENSELRDGMRIDWDVPIPMDDGVVLRADVYRPVADGKYPAIVSYGPYGKGLAFQEGYKSAWEIMAKENPDAVSGTSNRYQNWEVADPEKWVPDGYALVRVDSRGAGRSPGYLDHNNARENRDFHDCIEWAAAQPWCSGKVGLAGISYYAASQWRAAATQPPHLAAICVWEGWSDCYRESARHGGIICSFRKNWQEMQVMTVQHGRGERGPKSAVTGELVCGPETLPENVLAQNRANMWQDFLTRPLDGPYYRERSADFSRITVPLLSTANWGGQGLHPRGGFEGFTRSASREKWLEVHGGSHWAPFYTDWGVALQKRFFDYFLKGRQNGWDRQPRVTLKVRHPGEKFVERAENEWPLARTQWTKLHLDPAARALTPEPAKSSGTVTYDGLGDGVTFMSAPLDGATEITGPIALKLWISSSTADADIFAVRARLRSAGQRAHVPGRARSAHADRAGLAAGFAAQARSAALAPLPPVPRARREAAAETRRGLRARRRDLADLHRGAAGVARRAHHPRQGLRIRGRGRGALQHEEPDARLRAVRARRSGGPAGGGVRRKGHPARRARSGRRMCCCRSFPRMR